MGVQDSLSEEINMKEEDEELEETETLSLCDLPLYSDQSSDWDQYSSLNSTSSSSHQDFFEFFSQQLTPSASSSSVAFFPPENIIFCGKLIPYKHLSPPCKAASSNRANDQIIKSQTGHKKTSRWRWRLSSGKNPKVSINSKNGNKCATAVTRQPQRRTYNTGKQLRAKAKWYFFLFGVSRFSPVVELSDIRNRQSRRRYRSPPPPPSSPMMFGIRGGGGGGGGEGEVRDRGWGLWGLIRALSCSGGHRPTAVAAGG